MCVGRYSLIPFQGGPLPCLLWRLSPRTVNNLHYYGPLVKEVFVLDRGRFASYLLSLNLLPHPISYLSQKSFYVNKKTPFSVSRGEVGIPSRGGRRGSRAAYLLAGFSQLALLAWHTGSRRSPAGIVPAGSCQPPSHYIKNTGKRGDCPV